MFIAIFIAIVFAAGLGYFFMTRNGMDKAKADFENLVRAHLSQTQKEAIAMSTPDFDTSLAPEIISAMFSRENALLDSMTSIHQKYEIVIQPDVLLDDHYNDLQTDFTKMKIEWMSCPKTNSVQHCWENY